jgi:NAD(P)-dependent dehydrogenase (short-subunit alcohol dehydrogenase family)
VRLKDNVAIITGGGSGIGRATGELSAREGAKVVVADCSANAGREAVEAIKKVGGEAIFFEVGVSDPAQVERLVRAILGVYGGVDILVNAAAILPLALRSKQARRPGTAGWPST